MVGELGNSGLLLFSILSRIPPLFSDLQQTLLKDFPKNKHARNVHVGDELPEQNIINHQTTFIGH